MPFHNRQRGLTLVIILSNASLMFNLFVKPIALETIKWRYHIVCCVVLAVSCVVIFLFFPETRGRSLEDISKIFEFRTNVWQAKISARDEENMESSGDIKETVESHIEEATA